MSEWHGLEIEQLGDAVDRKLIKKSVKDRFKRPAYQYTSLQQKSYSELLISRITRK